MSDDGTEMDFEPAPDNTDLAEPLELDLAHEGDGYSEHFIKADVTILHRFGECFQSDDGCWKEGYNLLHWYLKKASDPERRAADVLFTRFCGYSLRTLIKRNPTK